MTLFSIGFGVDGCHLIDSSAGISQLHVSLLLATVSRIQKRPSFLQLTLESIGFPVGEAKFLSKFLLKVTAL
jgi:hypothetical protein